METPEQWVKYVENQQKKTPEWRHWRRCGVFIVNYKHISHVILAFPSLILNKWMIDWFLYNLWWDLSVWSVILDYKAWLRILIFRQ